MRPAGLIPSLILCGARRRIVPEARPGTNFPSEFVLEQHAHRLVGRLVRQSEQQRSLVPQVSGARAQHAETRRAQLLPMFVKWPDVIGVAEFAVHLDAGLEALAAPEAVLPRVTESRFGATGQLALKLEVHAP